MNFDVKGKGEKTEDRGTEERRGGGTEGRRNGGAEGRIKTNLSPVPQERD